MDTEDIVLFIVLVVACFLIGVVAGGSMARDTVEKRAVAAGVGQYNSTNRNFEWIYPK